MSDTKTCDRCGAAFSRSPTSSKSNWTLKRFCNRRCSAAFAQEASVAKRLASPAYHIDVSDGGASAALGSTALLRALLKYGATHDGLPGLPAERFRELACRHGVAITFQSENRA